MFFKTRTLGLGLACGGLGLFVSCQPVTPPTTDAVWDETNTTLEFGIKTDDNGAPVMINEGLTDLIFNTYFGFGMQWPDATIKIHAAVQNFTIRETTPASHDTPPGIEDDYTDSYDPGCTDTWWSRETVAGGGILFYYFEPLWSPYDCAGPETGGTQTWEEWNNAGHIQVFFNGIYVGSGYSEDFEVELLRQPLFYTPDWGDGVLDRNGVIQPWVDLNGDWAVDSGQDWDLDGEISSVAEVDLDNDGFFDTYEPDSDLDGNCDLMWEDYDGDTVMDVNEDSPDNGGNGDGIPGLVVSVDLDGDGTPEDYVGGINYYYDEGGRYWDAEVLDNFVGEDINCNGTLDENEVDEWGCWEDLNGNGEIDQVMIDLDGDGIVDFYTEDFNGNGVLDVGPDPDIDGDCHIDMPDNDYDGVPEASEDYDGDGNLDVDEDLNGDGECTFNYDDVEDKDNDGVFDIDETTLPLQCEGKPFGCEGDDVILVNSGDYLMAIPLLYPVWMGGANGHDSFYTWDTQWEDICTDGLDQAPIAKITLKLVHDDHSDIYGAPMFSYDVTLKDMLDMGIVSCWPTDSDYNPQWMVSAGIYECSTIFGWIDGYYTYYAPEDIPEEYR